MLWGVDKMAIKSNIIKTISATLALCMGISLCGCASDTQQSLSESEVKSDSKSADDIANITIWHYYNGVQQENFDNIIVEFNETVGHQQGIVAEARSKGTIADLADSIIASLKGDVGAETPPDMFASYAETAYIADKMGCIVDLSEYFTEDELGEYIDGYLEEGRFNGADELKIFPTAKSTEIMMLNVTDWQEFADSENISVNSMSTWEGLAETAEKYYQYTDALTPDIPDDGKAFFGRDSVANYVIVGARQLGLEFFTQEGDETVMNTDKDVMRRLWDCYYVPYVKGCYFAQSRFRSDDTKIGAIIAMVCSTTGASYFPDSVTINDESTHPIDALVLPVPNFENTEPYVVQQGAGMAVVKSNEKKERACATFLKWVTEKERNIEFSVNSGYLPVKKDANDLSAISGTFQSGENSEENNIVLDAMETAVSEINSYNLYTQKPFDKSSEVRDFLGNYIQDTAVSAREEVVQKIASGESRDTAVSDYISDSAFDTWYDGFVSGLESAVSVS